MQEKNDKKELKLKVIVIEEEKNIMRDFNDELKKSLENYIKYVIYSDSCKIEVKNWEDFKKFFLSNNKHSNFNNCNAILFLTFEETPRGDYSDSLYNKSRALRMFVENTMKAALTANHRNILIKLKELVLLWETRK